MLLRRIIPLICSIFLTASCGEQSPNSSDLREETSSDVSIGAFNMLRLGHGTKDMNRLTKLIAKADFDIFAGIEIMTEDGANELLNRLISKTGHDWKMLLSRVASGESSYKEYFAYYYRADKAKPIRKEDSFCARRSATDRQGAVCFARDWRSSGQPDFSRDPFVGHFKVGKTEFAFVAVHLIYGGTDVKDLRRRHTEAENLKTVLERVKKYTPKANVVALGDFNLFLSTDKEFDELEKELRYMTDELFEESPKLLGLINRPTTVGFSSYDHFLYFENNASQVVPNSEKIVYDFKISSYQERAEFKKEVSDHYPIKAQFVVE